MFYTFRGMIVAALLIAGLVVAAGLAATQLVVGRSPDSHRTRYGREAKPKLMATATFGAGCFWGVEAAFRRVPGVISTTVGYTGGATPHPTYEQVCAGRTGHTEAVEVMYDPTKVTYEDLLRVFWRAHDSTQKHKTQYKSVIYYHTPEQRAAAEAAVAHTQAADKLRRPITTEILLAQKFHPAEAYHQQYYEKRGIEGDACPR